MNRSKNCIAVSPLTKKRIKHASRFAIKSETLIIRINDDKSFFAFASKKKSETHAIYENIDIVLITLPKFEFINVKRIEYLIQ